MSLRKLLVISSYTECEYFLQEVLTLYLLIYVQNMSIFSIDNHEKIILSFYITILGFNPVKKILVLDVV